MKFEDNIYQVLMNKIIIALCKRGLICICEYLTMNNRTLILEGKKYVHHIIIALWNTKFMIPFYFFSPHFYLKIPPLLSLMFELTRLGLHQRRSLPEDAHQGLLVTVGL